MGPTEDFVVDKVADELPSVGNPVLCEPEVGKPVEEGFEVVDDMVRFGIVPSESNDGV